MIAPIPILACSNCNLLGLCMPVGLSAREQKNVDGLVESRRKITKGQTLFDSGMPFRSLFAIRSGVFKTSLLHEDGHEQVTGFHMSADMMGLEGIVEGEHRCDAVALEDSEICEIPFDRMTDITKEFPVMQHYVHRMMSREIVRANGMMMLLGHAQAEERLAAFFVNWRQRMLTRGFSGTRLILRMTRQEIGNYLVLTVETVSRTLTKFSKIGVLFVDGREIRILDTQGLAAIGKGQALANTDRHIEKGPRHQAGHTDPCSGTTTLRWSSRSIR